MSTFDPRVHARQVATLSPRQRAVLTLIARGWMNWEIAKKMGVPLHSVARSISEIYRKLGLPSTSQTSSTTRIKAALTVLYADGMLLWR